MLGGPPRHMGALLVSLKPLDVSRQHEIAAEYSLNLNLHHLSSTLSKLDHSLTLFGLQPLPAESPIPRVENAVRAEVLFQPPRISGLMIDVSGFPQEVGWHHTVYEIEIPFPSFAPDDHDFSNVHKQVERMRSDLRLRRLVVPKTPYTLRCLECASGKRAFQIESFEDGIDHRSEPNQRRPVHSSERCPCRFE